MRSTHLHLVAKFFLLAMIITSSDVFALEGDFPTTSFGVSDFAAGIVPPPSNLPSVEFRFASYTAKKIIDNNGNKSPLNIDASVNTYAFAAVQTTNISLLGAKYGWAVAMSYFRMNLDLGIPTSNGLISQSGENNALGDIQIYPFILSWTPTQNLFVYTSLMVQAPTGAYKPDRIVNAGVNHWVISPIIAFTYITSFGTEISSTIQLNTNTRNPDTDYRSGIEYQHEFAIGQHLGPWTIGVGGYYNQQITDDVQSGHAIPGSRARVFAAGPAVFFYKPRSAWPIVSLHAYKEFGARNRTEGKQIALRAYWIF